MSRTIRTVGLVGRHEDPRVAEALISLAAHLAAGGLRVLLLDGVELAGVDSERVPEAEMPRAADLVVAIGGDGTILYATRLVAGHDVPVLGINRGRLGFLADVSPEAMLRRVDEVMAGRCLSETRLMLRATLETASSADACVALNDVVVQKLDTGRMLDFETWIDGRYVNSHGGDGLIIATATGSTAYALSGGGPIIHPELDVVVLVPICPHTLSDRPIVVRADYEIEVRLVERPDTRAHVVCDGQTLGELAAGERLRVRRADRPVTLLHPPDHDYYQILRSKLHWGRGSYRHHESC
ncbi:MAG TPA: NAD(+) kinase [Gammaproteobacteria bacterium]|nr:NAD(+) kinase [Gammaproteobacteria bacterium]